MTDVDPEALADVAYGIFEYSLNRGLRMRDKYLYALVEGGIDFKADLFVIFNEFSLEYPQLSDVLLRRFSDIDTIVMEQVKGKLLTQNLTEETLQKAGRIVGKLHTSGIMHGDLTTSNMILREEDSTCVLIDFGLAQVNSEIEQRGVDIHVLYQTLESTAPVDADALKTAFASGYSETFSGAADVIAREHEIELRGRYL